jgi:hypothetical protein
MPFEVRFRVVSPILATKARGFVTLPAGSVIETSDSLDEPGLRFGNEELFTFTRDIDERAELMGASAEFDAVVVEKEFS